MRRPGERHRRWIAVAAADSMRVRSGCVGAVRTGALTGRRCRRVLHHRRMAAVARARALLRRPAVGNGGVAGVHGVSPWATAAARGCAGAASTSAAPAWRRASGVGSGVTRVTAVGAVGGVDSGFAGDGGS